MMNRYVLMYVGWLAGVLAMSAIAVVWYRHVEGIGYGELADRMRTRGGATDAPEDTEWTDPLDGDDTGFLTDKLRGE